MFKIIRRLVGLVTFVMMVFGAFKSLFAWLSNSAQGNHELFVDEEESERQF
jgi:hypothetical protein